MDHDHPALGLRDRALVAAAVARAYPDPVALPAIGVAVGRAYVPGLTARQSARLLARMRDRAPHG